MLKWLILWVVLCVATCIADSNIMQSSVKQTSKTIKKIESLTVQRLPKGVVRIQEQSTLESRRRIAIEAERLIRKAGIKSDKIIMAILVNAWHESRWNPKEDDGLCVGFFQLYVKTIGKDSTKKQLLNLNYNIQKILNSKDFKDWVKWCYNHPHESCGSMSFRFASHVEKCAFRYRYPRKITADRWYRHLSSV